jgi:hypothetical protein
MASNFYQDTIREDLARQGKIGTNPRHVEAWMRLEHGCLDGLSVSQFSREVSIAVDCINACTATDNERLAESFGL